MIEDVKVYFETIEKAEKEYAESEAALNKDTDRRVRDARYRLVRARLDLIRAESLVTLKGSSDPLVAWLADQPMRDYPEHTATALRALPATVDELRVLADDEGWCSEFQRYVEAAEDAGVLPGQKPLTPERRALVDWFRGEVTGTRSYRVALMEHVEKIVAAEVAAATAPDAGADDQTAAK